MRMAASLCPHTACTASSGMTCSAGDAGLPARASCCCAAARSSSDLTFAGVASTQRADPDGAVDTTVVPVGRQLSARAPPAWRRLEPNRSPRCRSGTLPMGGNRSKRNEEGCGNRSNKNAKRWIKDVSRL